VVVVNNLNDFVPLTIQNNATTGNFASAGILFNRFNGTSVTLGGSIWISANSFNYGTISPNQMVLSSGGDRAGGIRIAAGSGSAIIFATTSSTDTDVATEKMRITTNGNVGIGTPNPVALLQVQGNVSASSYTSSLNNQVGFFGTASWASQVISSSYAATASLLLGSVVSASYAATASLLLGSVTSASFATTAATASYFDGYITFPSGLDITGSLVVTGSSTVIGPFQATTKSFKIDHQRLAGKSLIYGVLEGPEHAVYARGRIHIGLTGTAIITLPEEWEWLVDADSITVQLTSIGTPHIAYVKEIDNNQVMVHADTPMDCFYLIHATRKDVPVLNTVE
jgi:hypothetical protein